MCTAALFDEAALFDYTDAELEVPLHPQLSAQHYDEAGSSPEYPRSISSQLVAKPVPWLIDFSLSSARAPLGSMFLRLLMFLSCVAQCAARTKGTSSSWIVSTA